MNDSFDVWGGRNTSIPPDDNAAKSSNFKSDSCSCLVSEDCGLLPMEGPPPPPPSPTNSWSFCLKCSMRRYADAVGSNLAARRNINQKLSSSTASRSIILARFNASLLGSAIDRRFFRSRVRRWTAIVNGGVPSIDSSSIALSCSKDRDMTIPLVGALAAAASAADIIICPSHSNASNTISLSLSLVFLLALFIFVLFVWGGRRVPFFPLF